MQNVLTTYKRYRTLQTHVISALPIVILMPHSACNCRCVMCDIWKGNHNLKQLTANDITGLLSALKKFGTQQVLMSGGEALLNPNFFQFCKILKQEKIKISLLSTGLTLKKNALQIVEWVDDVIVSLDGDETMHNAIRNIPDAFGKMAEGVDVIKVINPDFKITCRTVIHQQNFRVWSQIIDSAKEIGLDQISFLPADVSSHAFNREVLWDKSRQHEILPGEKDLPELKSVIDILLTTYQKDFASNYIAESPEKINKIYQYYASFYGLNELPYKKCNAPWVSAVIEADGTVRPCFFHEAYGNIKNDPLDEIMNSANAITFRKQLNTDRNETCKKCVCYLNLSPQTKL
ncbi:SPASM domain-containing protein [Ferruginibacter sp. SUN106]|uniref:radical SAM protein n=1 Tax=Ferruginibacter sp. SUN106 TaxID=2978348 RepID=UPI003D360B7B